MKNINGIPCFKSDLFKLNDDLPKCKCNKICYKVKIVKFADEGYIHFNDFVKLKNIPKIGQHIYIYYPDGSEYLFVKVLDIKYTSGNYILIIVENPFYD